MPAPSVTYTFSNGTTADATQVNQNFTDVINGLSDGTKDLTISALTASGTISFTGTSITFGNASTDTVDFVAEVNGGFVIDGSADEIQFLLQGHSSQTSNTFVIETSGGTDLLVFNEASGLTITGTSFATSQIQLSRSDGSYTAGNFQIGLTDTGTDGLSVRSTTSTTTDLFKIQNDGTLQLGPSTGSGVYINVNQRLCLGTPASISISGSDIASGTFTTSAMTKSYLIATGASGAWNLHGLAALAEGTVIILVNNSGQTMTVKSASATEGTATNRILTYTGADVTVSDQRMVRFIYCTVASTTRWLMETP